MKLLRNLLDKLRLWRGTHFRCQVCDKVISRRTRAGFFSILDDNGRRYWCRACAATDLEISGKVRRMEEISRSLRYRPNSSDPASTEQV